MTVCAFGAQRTLMHVVFAMAAIAIQRCLAKAFAAHVAFFAFQFFMFAAQKKIGSGVIKLLLVEVRNPCVSPLVIGMAVSTSRIGHTPMKSNLVFDIGAHVFMTRNAQAILGLPVKFHVALFAVILGFDVPLNHFARRHN